MPKPRVAKSFEQEQQEVRRKILRTENPLIAGFKPTADRLAMLSNVVTAAVREHVPGFSLTDVYTKEIPMTTTPLHVIYVEMPFRDATKNNLDALKALIYTIQPGRLVKNVVFTISLESSHSAIRKAFTPLVKPEVGYALSTTTGDEKRISMSDTAELSGVILFGKGGKEVPLAGTITGIIKKMIDYIPRSGVARVQAISSRLSEVEFAFQTAVYSLALEGTVDLHTIYSRELCQKFLRDIFFTVYYSYLESYLSRAERNDIYELDEQIRNIEINLVRPLKTGDGTAFHTLLVGAPGVGKSLVTRYLTYAHPELMFVPMRSDVLNCSNPFEIDPFETILGKLKRLATIIGTKVIVVIDDIEEMLMSTIMEVGGEKRAGIDPDKRSRFLNLLERLEEQDIFVIGSLNYPVVDPAFRRRMHIEYFPLLNEKIRKYVLEKILKKTFPVAESDLINELVAHAVSETFGYNTSSLINIETYLKNYLSYHASGAVHSSAAVELEAALDYALSKSRSQVDIEGLHKMDIIARELAAANAANPNKDIRRYII